MKIFKNSWFCKFAKKNDISDETLRKAVQNLEQGKSAVDLGAGLFKVRVAREGEGKSGGFRVFLVMKRAHWVMFLFAFAKADRQNLTRAEQEVYKDAARVLLQLSEEQLGQLVLSGEFEEIN